MPFRKTSSLGRIKPPPDSVLDWGDPINRGLLWFPLLNENGGRIAYDIARGNNGTVNLGLATPTGGRFGRGFNSVTSSNFNIQSSRNIGISGDSPATIIVWVNPTDVTTAAIFASLGDIGTALHAMSIYTGIASAGSVSVEYSGGNGFRTATGAIAVNNWYQLAAVKTQTGDIGSTTLLYINGVLQSFGVTATGTMNLTANPASMGCGLNVAAQVSYAFGLYDHMRVYNRGLTQSEVRRLYTQPFAGVVAPRRRIINGLGVAASASSGRMFLTY